MVPSQINLYKTLVNKTYNDLLKLKKEYSFAQISTEDFEQIQQKAFEIFLSSGETDFEHFIDEIKMLIKEFVLDRIYKDDGIKYFSSFSSKTDILEYYQELSIIINKLNISLDMEFVKKFLSFKDSLIIFLDAYIKNKQRITFDDFEKLSYLKINDSFIQGYLEIRNIEIVFDNEKENTPSGYQYDHYENDSYFTDTIKQYLIEMGKYPLLSDSEEKELLRKIALGDKKAKDLFIASNLRLVVSIAKRYLYTKTPFLDLIQEGNLGLIKAVDLFDLESGNRFSTYAVWWIRQSIKRSIADKSRIVRIPVLLQEQANKYLERGKELSLKLGREATPLDIAQDIGISESKIVETLSAIESVKSLNDPIGDKDESEFGDFLPDANRSVEVEIENHLFKDEMAKALSGLKLSKRDQFIIEYRYGIKDGESHTLEEVGNKLGITRERVRQIEAKTLKRMRLSQKFKDLKIYYDGVEASGLSFWTYFSDYPKQKVFSVVKQLPELEYNLLIECFGVSLDNKYKGENVRGVEKLIKKIINGLEFLKIYCEPERIVNVFEFLKTIYAKFPNKSIIEVDNAIKKLPIDSLNIIKIKYGDDLLRPVFNEKISSNTLNVVIRQIAKILNYSGPKKEKASNFYMNFKREIPQAKIDYLISLLSDKEIDVLNLVYPKGYKLNLDISAKSKYKEELDKIIEKVRKYLKYDLTFLQIDFYSNFPNCSVEYLDYLLNRLTDNEKSYLNEIYNNHLYGMPKLTLDRVDEFLRIKRKIKGFLLQQNKSFYVLLDDCNKEKIDKIIYACLNSDELNLLQKKYGQDLDLINPFVLNPEEEGAISNILSKLKKCLRNNIDVLANFPGVTYNVLLAKYRYLSFDDQKILAMKYGMDLKGKEVILSNAEEKKVKEVIDKLREALKSQSKNNLSLNDIIQKFSLEKVKDVVYNLSSSFKEIVFRVYGESLTEFKSDLNLTKQEKSLLARALKKINKLLCAPDDTLKDNYFSLFKCPELKGFSKDTIIESLRYLTKEELNFLYMIFGLDLQCKVKETETSDYISTLSNIISKIKLIITTKDQTLFDNKDLKAFSEEEIWKYFAYLSKEDQLILKIYYGVDLKHRLNIDYLSDDNIKLKNAIKRLASLISQKDNHLLKVPLLECEGFKEYSAFEIVSLISFLNPKYQDILKKCFGKNMNEIKNVILSKEEIIELKSAKKYLKQLLLLSDYEKNTLKEKSGISLFQLPEFKKYKEDEIVQFFELLDEKSKQVLMDNYGSKLKSRVVRRHYQKDSLVVLCQAKENLHQLLELSEKSKQDLLAKYYRSVFQLDILKMFSEDRIKNAINLLSEMNQALIKNSFGTILEKKVNFTQIDKNTFGALRNLEKILIQEIDLAKGIFQLSMFKNISKEHLLKAFEYLSDSDRNILTRVYGHSLDSILILRENLPDDLNYLLSNALTNLKKRVLAHDKIRSIFKGDIDEVIWAISFLKPQYQELIFNKYGDDLCGTLTKKSCDSQSLYYLRKAKKEVSNVLNNKDNMTLFNDELFNQYSVEQLLDSFFKLDSHSQKSLRRVYGFDLKTLTKMPLTAQENIDFYTSKQLLLNIMVSLNTEKSTKSLFDLRIFKEYKIPEIMSCFSLLSLKEQNILKLRYGNDLCHFNSSLNLSSQEKSLIVQARMKLKNILENPSLFKLDIYQDYSEEEILDRFSNLSKKHQAILKKVYGPDLKHIVPNLTLSEEEKSCLKGAKIFLAKQLKKGSEKGYSLFDHQFFNTYTEEEVLKAFSRLSHNYQELLKNVYGNDLSLKVNLDMNKKEYQKLMDALHSLQRRLNSPRKTLFNSRAFKDYSEEEIIESFNKLSPSYQNIIKLVYGDDLRTFDEELILDRKQIVQFNNAKGRLKQYLDKSLVKVVSEEKVIIEFAEIKSSILKSDIFKDYLLTISPKEGNVVRFKFGVLNQCYSDEQISKITGVPREKIYNICRNALINFSSYCKNLGVNSEEVTIELKKILERM